MSYSRLPPSNAARRFQCSGSRKLEEQYRREDSDSSREGRAAHWVALELIKNGSISEVDDLTPEGDFITEEMINGAYLYLEIINNIKKNASDKIEIHVEEKIDISTIHPECWGICDCFLYDPLEQELFVIEYKFGHMQVDAFENYQLLEYAAGIIATLGRPVSYVSLHIVQPRNFGRNGTHDVWSPTPSQIVDYINALRITETAAWQDEAPCTPGPECTFCSARHVCMALQSAAATVATVASQNQPLELTPQAVGSELRFLLKGQKELDARITSLKEQATALIASGKQIPYFALEQGRGRDKWTVPTAELKVLGELFDCEIVKEELITPKQAIEKGIPEDIVKEYYETPRGSLKITEVTDKQMRKLFQEKK